MVASEASQWPFLAAAASTYDCKEQQRTIKTAGEGKEEQEAAEACMKLTCHRLLLVMLVFM